jgi:hypothetical protein
MIGRHLNAPGKTCVAFCLSALTLSGCFSKIPFKDAPTPDIHQSAIYIYRTDSPPRLRKGTVLINNQEVCDLASEEFTWTSLQPGGYWLSVTWSPELGISSENIRLDVQDNQTLFVKIDPSTRIHAVFLPAGVLTTVKARLSVGKHPDQITEIWPLHYVAPREAEIKPMPPGL